MNWGELGNLLWPVTTVVVAYLVKTYFSHKLTLEAEKFRSQLKRSEECAKLNTEAENIRKLLAFDEATKNRDALKQLVLSHWSPICQQVTMLESKEDSISSFEVVEDLRKQIKQLRTAFARVNLFLPPEVTRAFASFYSNVSSLNSQFLAEQHFTSQQEYKEFCRKVIDLQGNLSHKLRYFFGLEESPRGAAILRDGKAPEPSLDEEGLLCDICGSITVRYGTTFKCFNCGNSMGCS